MSLKIPTGGQFENPAPGSYIARCFAFIDLGTQFHQGFQGNDPWSSRDVRLVFELPLALMTGRYQPDLKGKCFAVSITMKQSLAPTAKLRKFLRGWRGRDFTKEELAAYDPKKIVGAPCRLSLVENGDFINIDSAAKLSAGEICPKQINKSMFFSLESDEFDALIMQKLGGKTQEKIALSPEYAKFKAAANPLPEESNAEADHAASLPEWDHSKDESENVPF